MPGCIVELFSVVHSIGGDILFPVPEEQSSMVDILEISLQGEGIPSKFVQEDCEYLGEAHEWLIKTTQEKWRARNDGAERNEAAIPSWITDSNAKYVIDIFKKLNFLSEKAPKLSLYQCAAILGATAPNMEQRMSYFAQLIDEDKIKVEKLFLLTGTRQVDYTKYYDGTDEYLESVREKFGVADLGERELMEDVYDRNCLTNDECAKVEKISVFAKKESGRATTVDTLLSFSKYFDDCKEILYISVAPFIITQNEIIAKFANEHKPHNYETVGAKANLNVGLSNQKIAHYLVMSFAEALYSAKDRMSIKSKEDL
ncbi:MAG: hypothetical protein ACI8ZF_000928 [Candidatus Midichloriaceae bacterium]|jgi:hypothetical protein